MEFENNGEISTESNGIDALNHHEELFYTGVNNNRKGTP